MRRRVLVWSAAIGALAGPAVPATAKSSCASLSNVKSFHGAVNMHYAAGANGPVDPSDPLGQSEAINLDRVASGLTVNLTIKRISKTDTQVGQFRSKGVITFLGTVKGGNVSVNDSFKRLNGDGSTDKAGQLTHSGPADTGAAMLIIDPHRCRYEFHASFLVRHTTFDGDSEVQPSGVVGGAGWGELEHMPKHGLNLTDGEGPQAWSRCPDGGPVISGDSCYVPDGGWWDDFRELYLCKSVSASNCDTTSPGPFGDAGLNWVLKPKFKT